MKKVILSVVAMATIFVTACQKDVVAPLSITDETSVSTDIADVETPDANDRGDIADERGTFNITVTASTTATANSGDAGCTNYKYKGYGANGSTFTATATGDLNENIANVEGIGISNIGMYGKSATFTISLPNYTFGSVTVVFVTNKAKRISVKVKVVNVVNGLFYASTAYLLAAANVSTASGEAITETTDYPSAGNVLIIGGKRAKVSSYEIGKNLPRNPHAPILNKCTYDIFGESCNSGQKMVSWKGTGKFPAGTTAIVR
jgi:hypothetical protein